MSLTSENDSPENSPGAPLVINHELSKKLNGKLRRIHSLSDLLTQKSPLRFPRRLGLMRRVALAILPELDDTIICPTVYGFDLVLTPDAGGGMYYAHGCHEAGTISAIQRHLKPGDTFVDVGASVGLMTMAAAKAVGPEGRVLAFEPHPKRRACLELGVEQNGFKNIEIFSCGLSDKASQERLAMDGVSPSMVGDSEAAEVVETRTLDSILDTRVAMIKIDVEGFEDRVVRGARGILSSESPPVICFEKGADEACEKVLATIGEFPSYRRLCKLKRTCQFVSDLVPLGDFRSIGADDNIFCIPGGQ